MAEVAELVDSWQRHLRASGCKPNTISVYLRAERRYVAHAAPDATVDRGSLVAYLAAATRSAPATVRLRFRALSLFCAWLVPAGGRSPTTRCAGCARQSPAPIPCRC